MYFCSLFEIIQTLYFAVYGLTSVDVFRIDERHDLTEFVGKLMFGTYCACMVVVLINMLIAMLTQAYETISVCYVNPFSADPVKALHFAIQV